MLVDAHCHAQRVPTFGQPASTATAGVSFAVVCGTSEADWPAVAALAHSSTSTSCVVAPGFGVHPWWAGGVAAPAGVRVAWAGARLTGSHGDGELREMAGVKQPHDRARGDRGVRWRAGGCHQATGCLAR